MNYPRYKLGDVAQVVTGSTPSKSREVFWGGSIPFVTPTELDGDEPVSKAAVYVTDLGAVEARVVPVNSIMVCCIGSLGKVGIAGCDLITNQQINTLIFDESKVYFKYGYHFCKTLKPYLDHIAPSTTVAIVNKSRFSEIEIPLPPLEEQKRIAAILDKADSLRRKRAQAIALADDFLRATFLEMFGDPVTNPKGWPVKPLLDIVDPERPITYGILMPGEDQDVGVKYLRVVDMKDGGIDLSTIRKTASAISDNYRRSLLKEGDLVMSIRGHVGRLASVPIDLDGANITQDTARLAIFGVEPLYVKYLLRLPAMQYWLVQHTKGAAVKGINLTDVKKIPVLVPPGGLQEKFAEQVKKIESYLKRSIVCDSSILEIFFSLQSELLEKRSNFN